MVYLAALAVWLVTRWLVLVHQGAWPWMNAFVVAAARGISVGDWNEAVRPQLPAMLGVPLVLAGAGEQLTVATLYVLASLVQFGAFVVLARALYPERVLEQTLALLLFLLVPFNHSIHHYRDVPVVLACSGVFLLAAHWVTFAPQSGRWKSAAWVLAAMLLGVWSRTEVLAFVGALLVMGLLVWRTRALALCGLYAATAALGLGIYVLTNVVEGVDRHRAGALPGAHLPGQHARVMAYARVPRPTHGELPRSRWRDVLRDPSCARLACCRWSSIIR